ncbi:MAG TPA: tRNA dihydrouridine(20/20a) synthase DusA [Gammaproteobacteria bacterium]|nr:tRNA dihydrouridine(20/20a) synthase DusA [Gammaproteobacteria bacterium]
MENAKPLDRRISVAPMMDRTDRHLRYLLRLLAPSARLYTEMITARALLRGDAERLLRFDVAEHPVALQLGGAEPDELAAAARLGAAAGYDEINLNVGCPSDRVQAGCFGARLMLEPIRVAESVRAMRAAVGVPVTVKTRLGVDEHDSYEFVRDFVAAVAAAGCDTFIVHARKAWLSGLSPKQNREIPPLDYERVHRLKREFPELCIVINGGFVTFEQSIAELTHVDGVMIGRAAYEDSWLLARLDAALSGAAVAAEADVLACYERYVAQELARGTPLKAMTRHLLGMRNGRVGGRVWRRALSELADGAPGLESLRRLVQTFALAPALSFS